MAVENNVSIKSNSNLQQTGNTAKPTQYKINPNGVDKTPKKDTVQLSTTQKVGIGAGIVAAAVGLFFLFRGKKPPKNIVKQAEQVIPNEPPKMEMTEEAKKIYDDVASRLNKKTVTTSETIDKNLAPKAKENAWKSEDMKEYYTELEKETAEKAAKEAESKVVEETKVVEKTEVGTKSASGKTTESKAPVEKTQKEVEVMVSKESVNNVKTIIPKTPEQKAKTSLVKLYEKVIANAKKLGNDRRASIFEQCKNNIEALDTSTTYTNLLEALYKDLRLGEYSTTHIKTPNIEQITGKGN
ncbi:MAG: hypothetical protein ACI4S3_05900, partial [Candidatus Gastranaerophilaceae bacterium]